MAKPPGTPASFEETYPRYPFAPLVRLGIALAACFARRRARDRERSRKAGPVTPPLGGPSRSE